MFVFVFLSSTSQKVKDLLILQKINVRYLDPSKKGQYMKVLLCYYIPAVASPGKVKVQAAAHSV